MALTMALVKTLSTSLKPQEGLRQKNAIFGAVFSVLNALRQGSPLQAVPDYTIQASGGGTDRIKTFIYV